MLNLHKPSALGCEGRLRGLYPFSCLKLISPTARGEYRLICFMFITAQRYGRRGELRLPTPFQPGMHVSVLRFFSCAHIYTSIRSSPRTPISALNQITPAVTSAAPIQAARRTPSPAAPARLSPRPAAPTTRPTTTPR